MSLRGAQRRGNLLEKNCHCERSVAISTLLRIYNKDIKYGKILYFG